MPAPSFFATEFRPKRTLVGVVDVATVRDAIIEEMLALTNPWTVVSGTEYQSPIDAALADQRYMRLLVSRISATRLQFHAKDQGGNTVYDGRIDFTTSCTAHLFVGARHVAVELVYGGPAYESAWCAVVDRTPFPHQSLGTYVAANAHRNSSGTVVDTGKADVAAMNDTAGLEGRVMMYSGLINIDRTSGGSIMPLPMEVRVELTSGVWRAAGKIPQMIVVPHDQSPGAELEVPFEEGSGFFYVLGKAKPNTAQAGRIAVRAS